MDASGTVATGPPLSRRRSRPAAVVRFTRSWLVALTWCSGSLLLAFASLLLVRRLAGGLHVPLTNTELLGLGSLLAILAAVMHRGAMTLLDGNSLWYLVVQSIPLLGLVASVVAVYLPGSSLAGLFAMILLLIAEEGYWLSGPLSRRRGRRKKSRPKTLRTGSQPLFDQNALNADGPQGLPADVVQRMERTRGPQDQDVCWGQVRSQFQLGQRTESIHLAFCPPFTITPQLHFEQIEGPDAAIKATQVLPYGARLEIRLAKTNPQPVQTLLEFSAIAESR